MSCETHPEVGHLSSEILAEEVLDGEDQGTGGDAPLPAPPAHSLTGAAAHQVFGRIERPDVRSKSY